MIEKKLYNQLRKITNPPPPKRIKAGFHNGKRVYMIRKPISDEKKELDEKLRLQIKKRRFWDRFCHTNMNQIPYWEEVFNHILEPFK